MAPTAPSNADESAESQNLQPGDIVPIASFKRATAPNRTQRRTSYYHWGNFDFGDEGKVGAYTNKSNGATLFIMPDNTCYEVQIPVAGNQLFKHWKLAQQKAAEPEEMADSEPSAA